jgi:phthalate 3,4-dioxygenase ferredoxin reductase subunit
VTGPSSVSTARRRTAVVVGASIGGVRTAQALRAAGWQDRVVLVGAEPELPYDKPPLSKQLLAGTWEPAQARLLDEAEAVAAGIEMVLGRPAEHLDVAERRVLLAGGEPLAYDVLVVATGAHARPSPWRPDSGVHVVRTLQHALALRAALAQPGPVVVVGGSFLGGEIASTAHALGHEVVVVDPLPVPMGRVLGTEVGQLFSDLHVRHGVQTRFGLGVERVRGVQGDLRVELTDGSVLAAATVVVAIGARPADDWLADSGLLVDDGVVCDAGGRAQGARDVYAVGDVSRWFSPRRSAHVRIEHWTNAVEQAAVVAEAVLRPEQARPHTPVEYVWTDQHDWRAQTVGTPATGDSHVVLGDPDGAAPRFGVLYGDGSRLCGALLVNWPKGMLQSRKLLAAGADLADAVERLRAVLPAAPAGRG